jgi:hypothetical protein
MFAESTSPSPAVADGRAKGPTSRPVILARGVTLACSWGAFWGVLLGIAYLAPKLIEMYQFHAVGLRPWLAIDALLIGLFAAIGAAVCLAASAPVVIWKTARGSDFTNPAWAYCLITALILPIAYFASSALLEWTKFGVVSGYAENRFLLVPAVPFYLVGPVVLLLLYRRLSFGSSPVTTFRFLVFAFAIATLGLGALPLRTTSFPGPVSKEMTDLAPLASTGALPAPLLFVGIDGAEWRVLVPLLNGGALPNLHRLIFSGIHGDVDAIWGPERWSAPAWAAITTGYPREDSGVYRDLAGMIPGFPPLQVPLRFDLMYTPVFAVEDLAFKRDLVQIVPPPRSILRRPPFWELLSSAGRKTAVVRFRYTFPAVGQADYIVSDWVGRDAWSLGGLDPEHAAGSLPRVWPPERAREYLRDFSSEVPADDALLETILPSADREIRDAGFVDPIRALAISADIDQRSFRVARAILHDDASLSVLAVYLGGLDGISHKLWRYRFPEDFPEHPPSADEAKRLGPVLDRYLEFLDREIGKLIHAFAVPPNVIVVSDHGFGPTHHHPLFSGWHGKHGVFIAAGPGVAQREDHLSVSYVDVVPTILNLLGFRSPLPMQGHSLVGSTTTLMSLRQ